MKRKTLDIAIVACCHNYGRYLDDWAQSIVALDEYYPKICVLVDNGSTDRSSHQIKKAAATLRKAGIECVTDRIPFSNFGVGRNRAVELSGDTEWVMHFDADDTLMPHALQDVAELMPKADVIGFGYRRSGDLKAGPANRQRLYSTHRGQQTLRSKAPCSGVSPFRRWLWEKSPYREDMRGGWDTALWIGFAHLNARFVPTKRPVFYYRQHADSIFNVRRLDGLSGKLVGMKLRNLRVPITNGVSVVVPLMTDNGGARDRAWIWIKRRYQELHPDWEIVEGRMAGGEQWCKGKAIANGVQLASHHTLVIADSDCFIHPEALEEAVRLVQSDQEVGWVVPHTLVHRVDEKTTRGLVSNGHDLTVPASSSVSYERRPYEGYLGGGMVVVDRSDYEVSGGIPQSFLGWGAEDECLAVILDTILEPHRRLNYDLWHLYHPTDRRSNVRRNKINRTIYRVFNSYFGDRELMWDLIQYVSEGGDPLSYRPHDRRTGGVLMVAIETHKRGTEVIEKGEIFRASTEEAKRHAVRARKIAKPMNGSLLEVANGRKPRIRRSKKVRSRK